MNTKLKEALFPSHRVAGFTSVDGSILFYNLIHSRLNEGDVVLDFGAGRGVAAEGTNVWRRRLASTSMIPVKRIAVDVDDAVLANPFAVERHVMPIEDGRVRIPLPDRSVNLVICDWVVEHLPDPLEIFREFHRVLRPGGTVAVRTSNEWHYAYLVARVFGDGWLGEMLLRRAQPDRKEEDVFPKLYRANSRSALGRAFRAAGFPRPAVFTWDPEPAYVGQSYLGGIIGFILHRLALLGLLPRATLFALVVKE